MLFIIITLRFVGLMRNLQLHVVVATSISVFGVLYWFVAFQFLPAKGGYILKQERVEEDDGSTRTIIRKVPTSL